MIRFKTIMKNTRLTQFTATRELVILNCLPKTDAYYAEQNKELERTRDYTSQKNLFEFAVR